MTCSTSQKKKLKAWIGKMRGKPLLAKPYRLSLFRLKRDVNVAVDFVELFNPENFTANAQELNPGLIIDMSVDPEKDMRVDTYRVQARHDIGTQDPLIVIAAPPCTVFLTMQNINQEHHGTPEWEKKYEDALALLQFSMDVCWDQISRGKFFLHEHPATASSWDLPMIRELAEQTPWSEHCYRRHVSMGHAPTRRKGDPRY